MRSAIRRFAARARDLWERAKRERSSPPEVGFSVAVGVFSAFTPFLGLHMWIALGLATVFRLNRLLAFVASRISIMPVFALVTFCEIESAHRLRTGAWAPLAPREAVARGRELFVDWMLGACIVGTALALVAGLFAYGAARRWQRASTTRTPAAPRLPSSGSPPSGPPAPTP
jgi:uncharacterized protein (DUF2062 family)